MTRSHRGDAIKREGFIKVPTFEDVLKHELENVHKSFHMPMRYVFSAAQADMSAKEMEEALKKQALKVNAVLWADLQGKLGGLQGTVNGIKGRSVR